MQYKRILTLVWAAMTAFTVTAAPVKVTIVKDGSGYKLERDGRPYFIRGAGGSQKLDVLVEAGGNSIRTWGTDAKVLDEAQSRGLTVMMGLRVGLPRHGFDYSDREAVAKQLAQIRETVEKLKDHPALLMWGVGNEVEHGIAAEKRPALWAALNDIVKTVKAADPNHPVLVVLAGIGGGKLREVARYCPDVDAVGINAYGSMLTVPRVVAESGWTKPYVVTEFGPRGHWEVAKTAWGLPVEDNSTEKADFYLRAYQHAVSGQPQCLGSYVFLWGQKQEKTHTWYGMFLPEGNRTASVDALSYAWTGKWPGDRCPRLGKQAVKVEQDGRMLRCSVDVEDPEGAALTIRWDVRRDVSDAPQTGGDREPPSSPIEGAVVSAEGRQAVLRLPEAAGNYRVFVYAFDPAGNAATANVPVQVR